MRLRPPVSRPASRLLRALPALVLALAARAAPAAGPVVPTARPAAPAAKSSTAADLQDDTTQGLLRLGAKLSARGDYATAEIAYWQILHDPNLSVPEEKDTLLALAHMLRKSGSSTKAAAIYEKFLKEFPYDDRVPDALLELGRTLRSMGVYRLAISRFYSVINSTLKFPPQEFEHYELLAKTAQFEIAETHFEAGEYAEASKYFSRVTLLDLAPADRARASFMEASARALEGDLPGTVASLKTFLLQFPRDTNAPEARYLLATTLRELHRPGEALAVTMDLLLDERARDASDPRRLSYWQRRTGNEIANEFFQDGDPVNALAIYQNLGKMSAEPGWRLPITYQIALCYERLHQLDGARGAYREIIAAAAPPADGAAPSAEIVELGAMAAWRLAQLEWRDSKDRQFDHFFTTSASPSS